MNLESQIPTYNDGSYEKFDSTNEEIHCTH
jgi:hypothetical protein